MQNIEFIKPAVRWQPGDIASFSAPDAEHYIRVGVAIDRGPAPVATPRIPHPGEPGYIPEKHGPLHGEPVREPSGRGK